MGVVISRPGPEAGDSDSAGLDLQDLDCALFCTRRGDDHHKSIVLARQCQGPDGFDACVRDSKDRDEDPVPPNAVRPGCCRYYRIHDDVCTAPVGHCGISPLGPSGPLPRSACVCRMFPCRGAAKSLRSAVPVSVG